MENQLSSPGITSAVRQVGGQVALARLLGVSQQAISIWVRRGFVPLPRAQEIEAQLGIPRTTLIDPKIADLTSTAAAL